MYLDAEVRAASSTFASLSPELVLPGIERLRRDLETRKWHETYGELLSQENDGLWAPDRDRWLSLPTSCRCPSPNRATRFELMPQTPTVRLNVGDGAELPGRGFFALSAHGPCSPLNVQPRNSRYLRCARDSSAGAIFATRTNESSSRASFGRVASFDAAAGAVGAAA